MARVPSWQTRAARRNRRDSTWSEFRLWQALRKGQLGVKFRRQHPIGPYIVDFACLSPRLVVEADGWSHGRDDPVYVAARDRFLRGQGFAVLHLSDATVNYDLDNALRAIRAVIDDPAEQWRFNRME